MTTPERLRRRRSGTPAPDEELEFSLPEEAVQTALPVSGVLRAGDGLVPLRRQVIDEEYEDEIFDMEEAKRRNKLMDSAGGKIDANDPRKAMLNEHLASTGRATVGPQQGKDATAEAQQLPAANPRTAMLNEHLASTGRATVGPQQGKDATAEAQTLPATSPQQRKQQHSDLNEHLQGTERLPTPKQSPGAVKDAGAVSGTAVSGFAQKDKFDKFAGGRQKLGVDFNIVEQKKARDKVATLSKELAAELKAGRAATGDAVSTELQAYDAAIAAKDFVTALPLLEQVKLISAAALSNATSRESAIASDSAKVAGHPAYHKPPVFDALVAEIADAIKNKSWAGLGQKVAEHERLTAKAIDFATRFAEVQKETAKLKEPMQTKNMEGWIAEHKALSWDKVEASEVSTSEKGGLGNLEQRLKNYNGQAASVEAGINLRKQREEKGLIAGNGKILVEKKPGDLTVAGEKEAVEAALDGLKTGVAPTLTHPSGAKWGDSWANRDGDLPGVANGGGYKEYYVEKATTSPTYHGSRRLVVHNKTGRIYYSWTHYGDNGSPAFVLMT